MNRLLPKLRLSRLRDIGWSLWDPIGILGEGEVWDGQPFADEYDSYLRQVAGQLLLGHSESEMVDYLYDVAANHMGLGPQPRLREAAERTVKAIATDDKLWNYD